MVATAARNQQGDHKNTGWTLIKGIHSVEIEVNGKKYNVRTITARQPNGVIRNMNWDCGMYYDSYMLDPAMEDIVGRPEKYEKSHVDHLEERKKAWELTREYVLMWWEETGKDVDHPAPMTVYDVQLEAILPFFTGALSALAGKVIMS